MISPTGMGKPKFGCIDAKPSEKAVRGIGLIQDVLFDRRE